MSPNMTKGRQATGLVQPWSALHAWLASHKQHVPADGVDEEGEEAAPAGQPGSAEAPGSGSFLSGWVRSIRTSVVGTAALTRADIAPALLALKGRLMERNVAENIAEKCGAACVALLLCCFTPVTEQGCAQSRCLHAAWPL